MSVKIPPFFTVFLLLSSSSILAEVPTLPDSLIGTWSHDFMYNEKSVTHTLQAYRASGSRPKFRMVDETYSYKTQFIDWAIYGNQLEISFKLVSTPELMDTGHRIKYSLDISQPAITGKLYNSWKTIPQIITLKKTEEPTNTAPETPAPEPEKQSNSLPGSDTKKGMFTLLKPAPPIKFRSLQGNPVILERLKGKVVLLDFWATWCGPCVSEMPAVIELYRQYQGENFEIIGISLDKKLNDLNAFIEKNNMTWPQYFDGKGWDNRYAKILGIKSIPTTVLIDKNGIVRFFDLRGKNLISAVEDLLKEPRKKE